MPNTGPSLDAPSAAPSPEAERRRFVRFCCAPYPRVRSLVQPEMQFREGLLKDVSTRGLCLILDDAPEVGKGLISVTWSSARHQPGPPGPGEAR